MPRALIRGLSKVVIVCAVLSHVIKTAKNAYSIAQSCTLGFPFARFLDLGVTIGMGTDTHPADMIQNMAIGVMTARIAEGNPTCVSAADFYDAATLGGGARRG